MAQQGEEVGEEYISHAQQIAPLHYEGPEDRGNQK